jgi:hypothetical protein
MTMAQTYDATHDDRRLLAYLLRMLPDEQVEQVELAALTDDEVAERLKVVEHELVDGYVRDTLDAPTHDRFESYYLSSPIRRERVKFAAEFLRAIDAEATRDTPAAVPVGVLRRPRGWHLAAVAAVLVLTCGTLLLLLPETRTPQPERAAPAIEASGSTPSSSSAAALVLFPQTRTAAAIPTLRIAPGTSGVTFDLRLESNDYQRYQAGLRDPRTNATIWRSAWMEPFTTAGRSAVEVVVPASLLKTQHYSLDLTGRAGAGALHVVGSYAFNVTPP